MEFDDARYRAFFRELTGHSPFAYQERVCRLLLEGRNVILRAPTGAGKTWAVLAPFLFSVAREGGEEPFRGRPARLIYALPLRSLAQGIYRSARAAASERGLPVEGVRDERGREVARPLVTIQTGEQPDDPFFDRGRVIVTTYDQLLSGLLDGPYGLSSRLHNVNAAAVAGALVIFDEFHLMESRRAFLTAVATLRLFRDLSQSVWMTATATLPLEEVLRGALDATTVPSTGAEQAELLDTLPSVTSVTRHVVVESEALCADSVLRAHRARSIVLLNTVGRAQAMFEALRARLVETRTDVTLLLLHARFFRGDRRAKEEALGTLFGREVQRSAILVATQVVEAGLDISCDALHTELCPMNALVQRAGRCARFEGESGTVHVYPLPQQPRAWLPYGDLTREASALARTRDLLARIGRARLQPRDAAEWVQEAHGADDEESLREGWWPRLRTCLQRIEDNAFGNGPVRVADLIRGGDTDSVQVIIDDGGALPEVPGTREPMSVPRWSLHGLLRGDGPEIGWFWEGSDDTPWKPLRSGQDLERTYAVCLRPAVAAYDADVGLRLGVPGTWMSPARVVPPRPGHAPYREETWSDHARRVAAVAERRVDADGGETGLLGEGFARRYGLSGAAIREAARACALLHDLGKLQVAWQGWAEAAQRSKQAGYRLSSALAHTDFDPQDAEDRRRERSLPVRRPPHAAASAYYGRAFLGRMLISVPEAQRLRLASACTAAVLAHHGGWWTRDLEINAPSLWPGWRAAVVEAFGWAADEPELAGLRRYRLEQLLEATTAAESLPDGWPLVAYLTRTLRLSDQRATAEQGCHE